MNVTFSQPLRAAAGPLERAERRLREAEEAASEDRFDLSAARRNSALIYGAGALASLAASTVLTAVLPANTAHLASIVTALVLGLAASKGADRAIQGASDKTTLAVGMSLTGIGTAFYAAALTDGLPWAAALSGLGTLAATAATGRFLKSTRHHLPQRVEAFRQTLDRFREMEELAARREESLRGASAAAADAPAAGVR
ncbi:MAG: hypothetical protein AB1758_24570 [Candidatus Eremiobacterota bacterium]